MIKNIVNGIYELYEMYRTSRSGWQRAGVQLWDIENNAEHNCLTIQIAFILAMMEKVDLGGVVCTVLFHDNGEPRTGDVNKLNARYFDKSKGEKMAFDDFANQLPTMISSVMRGYFSEYKKRTSIQAIIAKDADLLQMAFQAKYYMSIGYKHTERWLDTVKDKLKTDSAKAIYAQLLETEFYEWSQELVEPADMSVTAPNRNIVLAIFELFEMTRTPCSEWKRIGLRSGIENLAERSCTATQIAFILSMMEKKNPSEVVCHSLFYQIAKVRTGGSNEDPDSYFVITDTEKNAFSDFANWFPGATGGILRGYFSNYEKGVDKCVVIVRDAYLLQMAFQAKYYMSIGFTHAKRWLDGVESKLKTDSAKTIYAQLLETEFYEWSLG